MRREQRLPWRDHGTHPRAPHFFMSIEMFHGPLYRRNVPLGKLSLLTPSTLHQNSPTRFSWGITSRARSPWPFPSVDIAARSQSRFSPIPEVGACISIGLRLSYRGDASTLLPSRSLGCEWFHWHLWLSCLWGIWTRWYVEGGCTAYTSLSPTIAEVR